MNHYEHLRCSDTVTESSASLGFVAQSGSGILYAASTEITAENNLCKNCMVGGQICRILLHNGAHLAQWARSASIVQLFGRVALLETHTL